MPAIPMAQASGRAKGERQPHSRKIRPHAGRLAALAEAKRGAR